MTILVAYVPRPEGRAALDKGIEIATRRNERLVVINAGPGGRQDDPSIVNGYEVERVEERLTALPITAEFRQFVRGKSAIDEIEELVTALQVSVLVIGLRKRSPVGKLLPPSGRERAEVKTWEALADGLLDAAILARLEATWPGRTAEQRSQAWIDRQMDKITHALRAMSLGLGDKPPCSGIYLSLSDLAVGCALGYLDFRFPHIDWRSAHPNLARLAAKLNQRTSFIETLPPAA